MTDSQPNPNLVLIVLDSVRKDFFDEHATRLQSRANVSFDQCRAASSWSVPSHPSFMTGLLPHQHGIHTHNRVFSGISREDTFLGDLPNHSAYGASANVYASSTFGFNTIFDDYSDIAPHRRFPDGMDMEKFIQEREETGLLRYVEFLRQSAVHEHPLQSLANGGLFKLNDILRRAPVPKLLDDGASVVARSALSKAASADEPFFLFTNFMDAHGPVHHVRGYDRSIHSAPNDWTSFNFDDQDINDGNWEAYEQDIEYHRELYAAAIDYLDRKVSAFIDDVQKQTDGETIFVVTADHGENLVYQADNRWIGHTSSLTEALLHVPLYVINAPDGMQETYTDLFSHLDLGDLIVGMVEGDPDPTFRDRVPAEVVGMGVGGPDPDDEAYDYWDRMIRCVYRGDTKVEWDSLDNKTEYRIDRSKPSWQEEVGSMDDVPDWATELFDVPLAEYKRQAEASEQSVDVGSATKGRLEDLGYI